MIYKNECTKCMINEQISLYHNVNNIKSLVIDVNAILQLRKLLLCTCKVNYFVTKIILLYLFFVDTLQIKEFRRYVQY